MLSGELNDLLTRTGPGTPMGELFRRFWLPAVTSGELVADGAPVRLRVLHEDMLAFRDTSGTAGIIDAFCSHRLAPLFFGRNEECGIRCPYHGWKFDVTGACVDIPSIAKGNNASVRAQVSLKSYPVREAGGVIWIYMGPPELMPAFPRLESTLAQPGHFHTSRWLQRSNWLAGLEGELDTAHISWLHKHFDPETNPVQGGGSEIAMDGAPEITLRETDYGFLYGARRVHVRDSYYWRVTQWMAPAFSLIPRRPGEFIAGGGRAWTPIDDDNVATFHFFYKTGEALNDQDQSFLDSGVAFPPRLEKGSVRIAERSPIDINLPVANIDNDYLVDRELQRSVNFSGIWGANEQDRALQESMRMVPGTRGVVDRTQEHLMSSDAAVATMRRRLIRMCTALADGQEPAEPQNAEGFAVRAISKICHIDTFDALRARYNAELRVPAS